MWAIVDYTECADSVEVWVYPDVQTARRAYIEKTLETMREYASHYFGIEDIAGYDRTVVPYEESSGRMEFPHFDAYATLKGVLDKNLDTTERRVWQTIQWEANAFYEDYLSGNDYGTKRYIEKVKGDES